jgi:hypothetical protein
MDGLVSRIARRRAAAGTAEPAAPAAGAPAATVTALRRADET